MVILLNDVKSRLINFLEDNSTVVVACSGGPDSMALLKILNDIKDKKNLNIICAHVNHKVRKESEEEKVLVENYTKKLNVIFEYYEITNYHEKANFHEDARKIRYEFLEKITKKYHAKYLMTAHHGDDLIETILMRIARGSNIKGYIGFKEVSPWNGITIVRPLIYKTKSYIEEYDKENNIPYAIDKTNYSCEYTRNRYRNMVLPILKEENENINLKYLKFSEELSKYYNYVLDEANKYLEEITDSNNNIFVDKFIKLPSLIQETIIQILVENIQKIDYLPINDNLFSEMIQTVNSIKDNISINLPNNYIFGKKYNIIYLKKVENKVDTIDYILDKDYIGCNFSIIFTNEYEKSNNLVALNSNEITLPLVLTNRNNGDYIEVLNMNGKKKINDIFIENKIDSEKRDSYPIVKDSNNNVIWIPGLKKSKFAKQLDEKYDIILKYEEK